MNKNNLPYNLYELRRGAELSQEEFAERLGVSRQAVSKWERGEAYPDTENLIAISDMFGVTIDELLNASSPCSVHNKEGGEDADALTDKTDEREGKVGFGVSVAIGEKISIRAGKGNEEDFDIDDDEDDEDDKARKANKLYVWYKIPYPIIATVAFLAIGLLSGGWDWAWTLFMTIPLYYSLLDSIRHRRCTEFAYPVLTAFLYCLLGMLLSWWHPGWIIFVTIPVYYPIAEAIDRYNKDRRR